MKQNETKHLSIVEQKSIGRMFVFLTVEPTSQFDSPAHRCTTLFLSLLQISVRTDSSGFLELAECPFRTCCNMAVRFHGATLIDDDGPD